MTRRPPTNEAPRFDWDKVFLRYLDSGDPHPFAAHMADEAERRFLARLSRRSPGAGT